MFAYLRGITQAIFAPGWIAWIGLIATYLLGIGFFSDYEKAKTAINQWQGVFVMPNALPLWLIVGPFLLWAFIRLVHKEGMRYCRAGRLVFDEPRNVPLWQLYMRNQDSVIVSQEDMSA